MDASHKDDFRSLAVGNSDGGSNTNPVATNNTNVAGTNDGKVGIIADVKEKVSGQYGMASSGTNSGNIEASGVVVGSDAGNGIRPNPNDVTDKGTQNNVGVNRVIGGNSISGANVGVGSTESISDSSKIMKQDAMTNNGLNNDATRVEDHGDVIKSANLSDVNGGMNGRAATDNTLVGNSRDDDPGFKGRSNNDNIGTGDENLKLADEFITSMNHNGDEIVLGRAKKKTKLIVGIVIAVVCVVVGVVLFLTLGLGIADPKTGDSIKARNYQEAFNIFANYFLFGEKSKEAVDWSLTKEADFRSFFEKVVNRPDEVSEIMTAQETSAEVIGKMEDYYDVFHKMYLELDNKDEGFTKFLDEYGRKMKFMGSYYGVGLPMKPVVLEKYTESGYDGASELIWQIADSYKKVGVVYDIDVPSLVGGYGDNQLAIIEGYSQAGCLAQGSIDYDCVSQNVGDRDAEYARVAASQLDSLFAVIYNAENDLNNKIFGINSGLLMMADDIKENREEVSE